MLNIGPFSIRVVLVAGALLLAWLLARLVPRRRDVAQRRRAASLLLDAFLVGLLAARLAWVLRWWPDYAAQPLAVVAIGDGGFHWWAGVLAAAAFIFWRARSSRPKLLAVTGAGAAGLAAWALALGAIGLLHSVQTLPDVTLQSLMEEPVPLHQYQGQPLVVNLWATWCPPCRREMPALARAQQEHPDVTFLMVNQGEGVPTITQYLQRMNLQFDHVLLDYGSSVMHSAGTSALPTTLFFDTQGRMVSAHSGEITGARLREQINRMLAAETDPADPPS